MDETREDRVPVLGSDDSVLSYTHPARARKLCKAGKARVVSAEPFKIKLGRDPKEDRVMSTTLITNFTEYFREEREVFIQNKSNGQVALQFEIAPGRVEPLILPRSKDPINLSQRVPFLAIKNSMDLRRLVNRRPPALALLSEAEFLAHYERKAKEAGVSVAEIMDEAERRQFAATNRQAEPASPRKTLEELADERKAEPPSPEERITPRVVGLCAGVGEDVDKKDLIPARDMLEELKSMDLTVADLEYLLGHGYYKTVKQFAQKEMETRSTGAED